MSKNTLEFQNKFFFHLKHTVPLMNICKCNHRGIFKELLKSRDLNRKKLGLTLLYDLNQIVLATDSLICLWQNTIQDSTFLLGSAVGILTAQTADGISFDTRTCIITVTTRTKHWLPRQPATCAKYLPRSCGHTHRLNHSKYVYFLKWYLGVLFTI